jgi:hypothetical protein
MVADETGSLSPSAGITCEAPAKYSNSLRYVTARFMKFVYPGLVLGVKRLLEPMGNIIYRLEDFGEDGDVYAKMKCLSSCLNSST